MNNIVWKINYFFVKIIISLLHVFTIPVMAKIYNIAGLNYELDYTDQRNKRIIQNDP